MLKAGDAAPDFDLARDDGGRTSTRALRGQRYVLYFYPKDDTPGCTREACSFRDERPRFDAIDVPVFGVSADDVKSHQKFARKFSLNFPLLADDGHRVADAFGTWVEKNLYGRKYMGIARATFVVDAQGRIERVWEKVSPDAHGAEVLAYLRGEASAPAAPARRATAQPVATKPAARPAAKRPGAKPAAKKTAAKKAAAKKPAAKKAAAKKPGAKKAATRTRAGAATRRR